MFVNSDTCSRLYLPVVLLMAASTTTTTTTPSPPPQSEGDHLIPDLLYAHDSLDMSFDAHVAR
jgi:hypothetical protein